MPLKKLFGKPGLKKIQSDTAKYISNQLKLNKGFAMINGWLTGNYMRSVPFEFIVNDMTCDNGWSIGLYHYGLHHSITLLG